MQRPITALFTAVLCVFLTTCGSMRPAGKGGYKFKITTSSREAQRAFDRGLTWAYAFAYQAAEDEFRAAAAADPECAMAWWGVALVNGPHINFPLVPPDKAKTAWEALTKARALAPKASEREQALIGALGKRYASPQPENRGKLDAAYASAMRDVWQAHPTDADIATLYAESMMDLRPWNLWTLDGRPQPGTNEIVATLERALALNSKHPGANHLYIHAVEASRDPGRALPAADRLRDLVPASGHLVHMPSHIYARIGRWDDAAAANARAMKADAAYRAGHPRPGFYAMYMAHNAHFYAYVAMMQGRSGDAIRQARQMVRDIPEDFLSNYGPVADGFMVFTSEVLMRFGKWDDVLAEPEPRADLPIARAMWHYTLTVALLALGRPEEAEKEKAAFHTAASRVPRDATFGNNSAHDLFAIATHMMDGEMAAKEGKFDKAIVALRRAVALEDFLRYDEPPDWIQPTRHTLGAVLMRAGRYADAEQVYRTDLGRYPGNGWSLFGLSRALRLQGKEADADAADRQFKQAWDQADVKLDSTCFCQPGV
jgi:tetratricopeptide (TPR) repeat protein